MPYPAHFPSSPRYSPVHLPSCYGSSSASSSGSCDSLSASSQSPSTSTDDSHFQLSSAGRGNVGQVEEEGAFGAGGAAEKEVDPFSLRLSTSDHGEADSHRLHQDFLPKVQDFAFSLPRSLVHSQSQSTSPVSITLSASPTTFTSMRRPSRSAPIVIQASSFTSTSSAECTPTSERVYTPQVPHESPPPQLDDSIAALRARAMIHHPSNESPFFSPATETPPCTDGMHSYFPPVEFIPEFAAVSSISDASLPQLPLPPLHQIPRPPASAAQRKYSSSLLTETRKLLSLSLSPSASPEHGHHAASASASPSPSLAARRKSSNGGSSKLQLSHFDLTPSQPRAPIRSNTLPARGIFRRQPCDSPRSPHSSSSSSSDDDEEAHFSRLRQAELLELRRQEEERLRMRAHRMETMKMRAHQAGLEYSADEAESSEGEEESYNQRDERSPEGFGDNGKREGRRAVGEREDWDSDLEDDHLEFGVRRG
jgi:hypothetical protein